MPEFRISYQVMGKTVTACFICFWIISKAMNAQTSSALHHPQIIKDLQASDSPGHVQIVEDRRIDSLLTKYVNNNYRNQTVPGFRIRIFSANNQDNGRLRAFETKAKFLANFPNIGLEVYVIPESPDWKVYIGDFRTRTEAFRVKKQIESAFPNNRLVESQIDFNKF